MYHLIALDPSLNTKFFVSHFMFDLKDELRAAVSLQAPTSVTRAVALAQIQEELELQRPRPRAVPFVRNNAPPNPVQANTIARKPADDFGRERGN